jgi:hypothetical protein
MHLRPEAQRCRARGVIKLIQLASLDYFDHDISDS